MIIYSDIIHSNNKKTVVVPLNIYEGTTYHFNVLTKIISIRKSAVYQKVYIKHQLIENLELKLE